MIEITRKRFDTIVKIYQIFMIGLMLSIILLLGVIQNKPKEAILCLLGFLFLKELYYYKIHSTSMANCFMYSIIIFACLTRLSLSINISILSAPILGLITAYIAMRISKFLYKPFNAKTSTADEIKSRAREKKLSDEQAEIIINKFVLGKTYNELCRVGESEKACQMRVKRIIDKLNK